MFSIPKFMPSTTTPNQSNVTTLRDVLSGTDASARPIPILPSNNMGNTTFTISLPVQTFMERSEVANEQGLANSAEYEAYEISQRPLDIKHATKFAVYALKGLVHNAINKRLKKGESVPPELTEIRHNLGQQKYHVIQPVVCNIRACEPDGADLQVVELPGGGLLVYLSERLVLWIVDGQHRRAALQMVVDFLRAIRNTHKFPARPKLYDAAHKNILSKGELNAWNELYNIFRAEWTVAMEVHLGLNEDQERQMFHDLNNLGKKVEESLAYKFDNANPINRFIKWELVKPVDEGGFWKPLLVERDVLDWHTDEGAISRKDVIAVNAVLFLNKTNVTGAQPSAVDRRKEVALRFWEAVNQIDGFGEPGAKMKTIAAQPVVLKALAKLTYDFAFSKNPDEASLERLLDGIANGDIDFSHDNPVWRYYELTTEEVRRYALDQLSGYLPSVDVGANRDIGKYDSVAKVMRFGAKHNDIFPILGDMIRCQLDLPSRRKEG